MTRNEFLKTIGIGAGVTILAPSMLCGITEGEMSKLSNWHFYSNGIRYNVFHEVMGGDEMYDLETVTVIGDGLLFRMKVTSDIYEGKEKLREVIKNEALFNFERIKNRPLEGGFYTDSADNYYNWSNYAGA